MPSIVPSAKRAFGAMAIALLCASVARGQNTLTVSANPPLMLVSTAVPGSEPTTAVNATTTYTVQVSTGGTRRIRGRLMVALPVGTTVTVTMAAPPGATSMGAVTLTTALQDLVINIPQPTAATTRSITYTFTSTVAGGVIASSSQTIRFRLLL